MKSFKIAFYLDFIAGLVIIGFALIQAIKNIKDWINVPGAFKEFLFQILIISRNQFETSSVEEETAVLLTLRVNTSKK